MNCTNCGAPTRWDADKCALICEYCRSVYVPEPNEDGVRVFGPSRHDCPICRVPLSLAAINRYQLEYCSQCHGMLAGMEQFSALVDDLRASRPPAGVQPPRPSEDELHRSIACPGCGKPMDIHRYGGPGNVIVETCEVCSFIWLDHNELHRIVVAPDHHYAGASQWPM